MTNVTAASPQGEAGKALTGQFFPEFPPTYVFFIFNIHVAERSSVPIA